MRILISTDYLVPGDAVDRLLRGRGHHTTHSPAIGTRPAGELAGLLADADAALVASEPITSAMLDAAPTLVVIARTGVGYEMTTSTRPRPVASTSATPTVPTSTPSRK